MKPDRFAMPLHNSLNTTQVNGIPIRRTFSTSSHSKNICWYAAGNQIFDVRWLGVTTDIWLEMELSLGWRQAIRQLIGDRDMGKWLAEREAENVE